jgi:hypothetical protein
MAALKTAVPLPENGSRTVSPGFEYVAITESLKAEGNIA